MSGSARSWLSWTPCWRRVSEPLSLSLTSSVPHLSEQRAPESTVHVLRLAPPDSMSSIAVGASQAPISALRSRDSRLRGTLISFAAGALLATFVTVGVVAEMGLERLPSSVERPNLQPAPAVRPDCRSSARPSSPAGAGLSSVRQVNRRGSRGSRRGSSLARALRRPPRPAVRLPLSLRPRAGSRGRLSRERSATASSSFGAADKSCGSPRTSPYSSWRVGGATVVGPRASSRDRIGGSSGRS